MEGGLASVDSSQLTFGKATPDRRATPLARLLTVRTRWTGAASPSSPWLSGKNQLSRAGAGQRASRPAGQQVSRSTPDSKMLPITDYRGGASSGLASGLRKYRGCKVVAVRDAACRCPNERPPRLRVFEPSSSWRGSSAMKSVGFEPLLHQQSGSLGSE